MTLQSELTDDRFVMPGRGCLTTRVEGAALPVFTYRPSRMESGILFVFDGLHRNAESLRDKTEILAERTGLITFAPLFDRERFPKWRYDMAGVVRRGEVQPQENWTAPLLQDLIDWARTSVNMSAAQTYLFGHSAGGQLLSRICAYSPLSDIQGIVITNPSAYVAPDPDEAAPFGFDGVFAPDEAAARLQVYLALPITVYLGQEDTGTRHLATSKPAMRQGPSRVARGRGVFGAARKIAGRHGWAFNWRLIEVPGVGHSSRAMLKAKQCAEAFGLGWESDAGPWGTEPERA